MTENSEKRCSAFEVGDRVSHSFDIDIEVVYGLVVECDDAQTRVLWADGSGPTWHKSFSLRRLTWEDGFRSGWTASGEGHNGEYPDEGVPWETSVGRRMMLEASKMEGYQLGREDERAALDYSKNKNNAM